MYTFFTALLFAVTLRAAPRALVEQFAAAYLKQNAMYGLLEGKDRRAMAPFLSARLLHILDDASACQCDRERQQSTAVSSSASPTATRPPSRSARSRQCPTGGPR